MVDMEIASVNSSKSIFNETVSKQMLSTAN